MVRVDALDCRLLEGNDLMLQQLTSMGCVQGRASALALLIPRARRKVKHLLVPFCSNVWFREPSPHGSVSSLAVGWGGRAFETISLALNRQQTMQKGIP